MALIIRGRQMKKFEETAVKNFEDEMVEHLRNYAPELSKIVGAEVIRTVVKMGEEKAKSYGFTNRGPVKLVIECMFSLGCSFDGDPLLPWAKEILNDASLPDQAARADILFEAQERYFEAVAGPNQEYSIQALRRFQEMNPRAVSGLRGDFETRVTEGLAAIYPEKAAHVGTTAMRTLATRGREIAGEYGVTVEAGVFVIVGTMCGFGYGAVADPLYPWIGATLADSRIPDPNERAKRLYEKLKIYVDRMIHNLA